MKTNDLPTLDRPGLDPQAPGLREWRRALAWTAIALAAVVPTYWDAVVSVIATWNRTETYSHGYVIFPISAWLIWRRRQELRRRIPKPFPAGLLVLAFLSATWLVGELASVQSFREFALIASVPMVILTVLGAQVASAIAFPLAFMLFAWPVGDFLLPTMMDWTADFTVAALQASGIPVYREGNTFLIPSGAWSVVDACSGLRYLIASFCVGTLYAHLMYRSIARRLAFVALAITVPIVANWLRAYGIVMLGHLSGNKIAVGVDHLIYGWLFFGVVMLALFAIGGRWREDGPRPAKVLDTPRPAAATARAVGVAAILSIAALAIGPAAGYMLEHSSAARPGAVALAAPSTAGTWRSASEQLADWSPRFTGAAATLSQTYARDRDRVALHIAYYRNQREGAEMINFGNVLVSEYDHRWKLFAQRAVDGERLAGVETDLRSGEAKLLVWQWYWIEGDRTASPLAAKLMLARSRLFGRGDDSAAVFVYARDDRDLAAGRARIESFVREGLPAIEATLRDAATR